MGDQRLKHTTATSFLTRHSTRRSIIFLLSILFILGMNCFVSTPKAIAAIESHWTKQESHIGSAILDIEAVDRETVWAAGANSVILRTIDGGTTWRNTNSGAMWSTSYSKVSALDLNIAWVHDGIDKVLRTTDGGDSWEEKVSPTVGGKQAFDAASVTTAWVVGGSGMISKTTDGGDTWIAQTSGTTNRLYAIDAVDESTAWASGEQGAIMKTIDGGLHWMQQNSGTTEIIQVLSAVDSDTAWAIYNEGALRTTDGGATWAEVDLLGYWQMGDIWDISAIDANTAWIMWDLFDIFRMVSKTCDGGSTWNRYLVGPVLIDHTRQTITAADARNVWVAGDGGEIMYTSSGGGPTWYIAEGCTAGGMETWILVQNTGSASSTINIDFMTDEGLMKGPQEEVIPPYSRRSYNAGTYVDSFNVSTKVTVLEGSVVCERATYGNNRTWAHDCIGTTEPEQEWYMAEGSSAGGMETWILVLNPNDNPIEVKLDFMTENGSVQGPIRTVPAYSRTSFNVGDYIVSYDVSTIVTANNAYIICERATYGNDRAWAHASIGKAGASAECYLAEGCAAGGMETFILIQNPSTESTKVDVQFHTDSGLVAPPQLQGFEIPPQTRKTLKVNDYVNTYHVSTYIETEEEGRVVCERAMYGNNRAWAHASVGPVGKHIVWFFPEGSTDGGMETWVLVQNPNEETVQVSLTLMTDNGPQNPPELQNVEIAARTRVTFPIHDYVKTFNVSTKVVSTGGSVVCERAMYGGNRTWAHDSIGALLIW